MLSPKSTPAAFWPGYPMKNFLKLLGDGPSTAVHRLHSMNERAERIGLYNHFFTQKGGVPMRNGEYEYYEEDAMGWSAFVAGALIGAGVALLFAPQTGTELRGMLRNYASRAKDEAMERGRAAWDTAVERGREYYDKGQEAVQEAGRSAREYAQTGKDALRGEGREHRT
jgi:gas vesicle protein